MSEATDRRERNHLRFAQILAEHPNTNYLGPDVPRLKFDDYRCANCKDAPVCPSAFDPYNTDGDCLEEK